MTKLALVLAGLFATSLPGGLAVQAQTMAPSTPTTKQRAPGVPLAPRAGDATRAKPDDRGKIQGDQRGQNGERPPPQPDREPPMPKPVPSIIAP